MNGTRTLTRVDIRIQADISATLSIENMTSAPLGNWTLEGQHLVLTALERDDSKVPGPFAFAGGLNIAPFTDTLSPSDGTAGSGTDFFAVSDTTSIDSLLEMDPSYLSFFKGGGEIKTIIGPFTESFLGDATHYDPKGRHRRRSHRLHRPRPDRHVQPDLRVHRRPRTDERADTRRQLGGDPPSTRVIAIVLCYWMF